MLEFNDLHYFEECLRDQNSLMVPVIIRRCINVTRNTQYPDDPPSMVYEDIQTRADVREAALQEVAHSGGVLLVGDNVIWTREMLRGPGDGDSNFDPAAVADVIIIHNQEFTVVGYPLIGRLCDPIIGGYQAYIRRRRGGTLAKNDPARDE